MSNTTERWWVRLAARWLAYIDGIKGQVQMFSLAVTAFSTFSIMLQGFGLGYIVPYLGGVSVVVGLIYTYLYNEGGVRNQVSRDRQDLSNNFSDPDKLIAHYIGARQNAMIISELTDQEYETVLTEMLDETTDEWQNLRDGIDLDQIK